MTARPITPVENAPDAFQGPQGVLEFLFDPPLVVVLGLLALAGLLAYFIARRAVDRDITLDDQLGMQIVAGTVINVSTLALVLVNHSGTPYVVDVGLSFAVGYGTVLLAQAPPVRRAARGLIQDGYWRVNANWSYIGIGALVFPRLAKVGDAGVPLNGARYVLLGLAVAFIMYNWVQYAESKSE